MTRITLLFLTCGLFCSSAFAQKGNNQIGVGADLSLPTSQFANYYKAGIGAYAKAMFGVGRSGQVTFTSGYSGFKQLTDAEGTSTISIIPLSIGYRANFNGFFAEPQIGYGVYEVKIATADGGYFSGSGGSLMWAMGIGYVFNKQLEVSARYQSIARDQSNIAVFALRLGYNFSLNSSKK